MYEVQKPCILFTQTKLERVSIEEWQNVLSHFEAAKVSSPRGPECLCQWDVSFYPFHYTEIFTKLDSLLNVDFFRVKRMQLQAAT